MLCIITMLDDFISLSVVLWKNGFINQLSRKRECYLPLIDGSLFIDFGWEAEGKGYRNVLQFPVPCYRTTLVMQVPEKV